MVLGSPNGSDHESRRIKIRPSKKRGKYHLQVGDDKRTAGGNRLGKVKRRKRNKFENETIRVLLGDPIERPGTPILSVGCGATSGTKQAELLEYSRTLEAYSRTPIEDNALRLQLRKL
ncbi:MAG: hypothetical protein M1813_001621, partial [Trichoglossum hirsutum]